ncbi:MAG: 50S ribosomal protein L34e [Candidatus Woesearchaeota archaeon]
MPSGKHKSNAKRKVSKKTPGGRLAVHYEERTPSIAHCAMCGVQLSGVPRDVSKCTKTQKRPERPFGGVLCSSCSRRVIKEEAHSQ